MPVQSTEGRRRYVQRERAAQTEATRRRIFDAAYVLFTTTPYDDVTLDIVAEAAGVSVPTVLRHVGSKEGLLFAGAEWWMPNEEARRRAQPGDIAGIARVLAARYEELGVMTQRFVALAERIPAVAELLERSRQGHHAWLAEMFAEWLPSRRPAVRTRRLAQLFAATEIYSWTTWRTTFGLTGSQAEQSLTELLHALTTSWETDDRGGKG